MENRLDLGNRLEFHKGKLTSPDEIIAELGQQLEKETHGFVRGVVKEYKSGTKLDELGRSFASITEALGTSEFRKGVQNNLGKIGYETYQFEFFLIAPKLERYKYRILFFEYGIAPYPVRIVLEQGIADEIFGKENSDYEIVYDSEEKLTNVILNVLNTKKVIQVMQELIDAAQEVEI